MTGLYFQAMLVGEAEVHRGLALIRSISRDLANWLTAIGFALTKPNPDTRHRDCAPISAA